MKHRTSLLARLALGVVGLGFALFLIGLFPGVIGLDITPDIGVVQIFTLLVGLSLMTLGAYMYMYATRHRARPRRLREDVGLRLMATGLVICYASGLADVLGIGSNFGAERPAFGVFQEFGVTLGVIVIIFGILLYSKR